MNIILMAGEGERFKTDGYRERKPFIPVNGAPMVLHTAASLPPSSQWILVSRAQEELGASFLYDFESQTGVAPQIVEVPRRTQGPAESCLYARSWVRPSSSVLVSSCDYSVGYDAQALEALMRPGGPDVLIWTTSLKGRIVRSVADYAYCKVADRGRVLSVHEKTVISDDPWNDPMVLGTFWFRRAEDLFSAIEEGKRLDTRVNGELYIATCINHLLSSRRVEIFEADKWISFGTPVELKTYSFWKSYFDAQDHTTPREPAV